jgi:hypothetical protein
LLLFAAGAASGQARKLPVPPSTEQKQAVERIRGIFPEEYSSTKREVKVKLGQELLKLAKVEKDPTARFALYREAVQAASTSGDVATTFTAIDGLSAGYEISDAPVRMFALEKLAKVVLAKEDCEAVIAASEGVASQLVADNRFDEAKKILGTAFAVARKLRGTDHAARLREAASNIDTIADRYQTVADAAETLKGNPADPDANLQLGRYECFEKGNWDKGLVHLTKGSDEALKKLAQQTLAKPTAADAQYQIAEGWWKAAESLKGTSQTQVRGYASHWYQEALPQLTGLNKAMAQKRVDEVQPTTGAVGRTKRGPRTINLLEQIDPDEDFKPKEKWAIQNGTLVCTQGSFVPKVVFPYQPPAEYDVKITFAQPDLRNGVGIIMPNPNGEVSFCFAVGGNSGREIMLSNDQRRYQRDVPNLINRNVKYSVVFKVRKAGVQATINGVAVLDLKTDFKDLKIDGWRRIDEWQNLAICADDPTVFYEVEVTEVTGEGAMTRFPKE